MLITIAFGPDYEDNAHELGSAVNQDGLLPMLVISVYQVQSIVRNTKFKWRKILFIVRKLVNQ